MIFVPACTHHASCLKAKSHLPGNGVHFLEVGELREAAVGAVPEAAALLHIRRGVLETYAEPAGGGC